MAQEFISGVQLACELREALKFERHIRGITINAICGDAASITIEFVPDVDDLGKIVRVFERYGLAIPPNADPKTWRDSEPLL